MKIIIVRAGERKEARDARLLPLSILLSLSLKFLIAEISIEKGL
jgi:hypothetical protein